MTSGQPTGLTLEVPSVDLFDSYRRLAEAYSSGVHAAEWLAWAVEYDAEEFLDWIARATRNRLGYTVLRGSAMHMYWLVEDQSTVVGVAVLFPDLEEGLRRKHGHVHYRIHPDYQKGGRGTQLLGLTLDRARSLGMQEVTLCANADNEGSLKLIRAHGGVFESELEVPVHGEVVTRHRFRRSL